MARLTFSLTPHSRSAQQQLCAFVHLYQVVCKMSGAIYNMLQKHWYDLLFILRERNVRQMGFCRTEAINDIRGYDEVWQSHDAI